MYPYWISLLFYSVAQFFSYCLSLNERLAERRKNLVSDKHIKTDIVLHMPTVHPVLLQMARTVLLDAR